MKRSAATIIFLLFLAPGTISVMPTKIELVSRRHHVWGFAGSEPERGSYDIIASVGVSGSVEGRNMDGRWEVGTTSYQVDGGLSYDGPAWRAILTLVVLCLSLVPLGCLVLGGPALFGEVMGKLSDSLMRVGLK